MKLSSIQFKIVAIIILVLLVGTTFSLTITLRNQRQNLLDATQGTLALNTDMLVTVIRSIMLSGEAPIAERTLTGLNDLSGFERVGIYRTDGSVAFHDYQTLDTVNANQDMVVFQRTPRADFRRLDGEEFQQVLRSRTPVQVENTETRELEYYFPILNYAECRTCHGQQNFVRGVAHFRVSIDGIYEQINLARNILIALFAVTGLAIALAMILSLNRAIVSPVLRIGEVVNSVGSGDLDTTVDVRSQDEIGDLGEKINTMIGGLKERDRLVIENERIETRNRENRKYLDNIQEGLLLIGPDHRISDQYSRYVTSLFHTESIAGLSVVDFLFPDKERQKEERRELEQFLTMLFENTNADMEMILRINPLEEVRLPIKTSDGETTEIVFSTLFHRIWGDAPDQVENVMIIFQDKTDITRVQEELEVERQRSQSEVEHITSLLRAGPQAFVDFVEDAHRALEALESNLDRLEQPAAAQQSFRDMHSLKGAARYLEFNHIAETTHTIEDIMASKTIQDESRLRSLMRTLGEQVEAVETLNRRFTSFVAQNPDPARTLTEFLRTLRRMVRNVAEQLGKKVEIKAFGSLQDPELIGALRNPIIHLVRNAVDHGIEDPLERISEGKSESGLISLRFTETAGGCTVEILDDGMGINFEAVRQKAIAGGLIGPGRDFSRSQLAALLFTPAFSSRSEVTDISGRGVGLDVVKSVVADLGGDVTLATQQGRGTKFTIRLPSFPANASP